MTTGREFITALNRNLTDADALDGQMPGNLRDAIGFDTRIGTATQAALDGKANLEWVDLDGAVGDDDTVDTVAIQAAIDLAQSTGLKTVKIPSRVFKVGSLDVPWGVSLIGDPGATLHLSGAINLVDPGLFDFTVFENIQFAADGIVAIGINAVAELENNSIGQICGLSFKGCRFIALDADIDNPGFRASEEDFFQTAVYAYDVAFLSFDDNTWVGGFEISGPSVDAEDSAAVKIDGQTIRVAWASNNNVQSYCYGLWGVGDIEGVTYEGGEMIYVRRGIHLESDTDKPGGWIKGGHFNCSEVGVYVKNRNSFTIAGVNAFRNSFYEDRSTWDAVVVDTCTDGVVSNVVARPTLTGFTGDSTTVRVVDADRLAVSGIKGRYTAICVDIDDSRVINLDGIVGDQHTSGITTDASCEDIRIGTRNFSSTTTPLNVHSSSLRTMVAPLRGRPEGSSTAISAAATVSIDCRDTSWVRRTVQAGSGAYNYDINLSIDGADVGSEIEFTFTLQSANGTVRIYSNDGALLKSVNGASGTVYTKVRNTGVWRLVI